MTLLAHLQLNSCADTSVDLSVRPPSRGHDPNFTPASLPFGPLGVDLKGLLPLTQLLL